MFKILTYNNISRAGLDRLPSERFEIASQIDSPDAILLRSFNLHNPPIPESVKAVGLAGFELSGKTLGVLGLGRDRRKGSQFCSRFESGSIHGRSRRQLCRNGGGSNS